MIYSNLNKNYSKCLLYYFHGLSSLFLSSDYRPMPHLDVYDENVVDDEDYEAMTAETRAAAEREMRKRDRQEALSQGRMRPDLLYGKHSNYITTRCI